MRELQKTLERIFERRQMRRDWIVLKYDVSPNELVCERCGGRQVMPAGPIPTRIFIAIGDAFKQIHKNCKEERQLLANAENSERRE